MREENGRNAYNVPHENFRHVSRSWHLIGIIDTIADRVIEVCKVGGLYPHDHSNRNVISVGLLKLRASGPWATVTARRQRK